MLDVAGAIQAVLARVARTPSERVAIGAALGRVIAADLVAARALPGFASSAMDGYGARAGELPATLPVIASIAAGEVGHSVPAGAAVRILTGAPVPDGVDTVVIQEDATRERDRVSLPAARVGDNIRRAGEDLAVGELAITEGTRLRGGELGLLAALGVAELAVARAPRVAVIATGDELVDIATTPGHGQLVDSSAHMLAALIREAGGEPTYLGIARDDEAAVAALISRGLASDVVITTGGVSVGDRDHVHAALAAAGVKPELWKVAMKPGKPFAFGTHGATLVFGLPGNPVSTFTAFELFVRPALLAMQGAPAMRPRAPVHLAEPYRKAEGRAHYLRARVVREASGLVAHVHAKQGSAMLSSLVGCNALVEIAAEITYATDAPALLLEPA